MTDIEKLTKDVAHVVCKLRGWNVNKPEPTWTAGERDAFLYAVQLQGVYGKLFDKLHGWGFDAAFIGAEIWEQSIYDWNPDTRTYEVGRSLAQQLSARPR
jgi:hypothetical protein